MALSVVYTPQGATTSPAIDIVAVHGLGGDAIDTWTHPKSEAFWLKDFLPQQIPDARIMTFGYNAAAAFGQSMAGVIDHAKSLLASLVDKREELEEIERPLIFIAHSLGGIVVKQALLQARLEPLYQSIKDATLGLIFLGTPHRGSDKATYGKVLANVAQFMSHRPPARLLTALQTNSDVLFRLTSDFKFQLPDYQVYSFFELRPMKRLSSLIVEKHSALLEVNHEEQIPVDADHSAMCKFETQDDPTFDKVYKRVKRIKNNPRRMANEQSASSNTHFEVPHLLSAAFTGRDEDLQRLNTSFAVGSSTQRRHQRRFVLFGLGGSGKTQICLKYVQDHRERYWGVFWVEASSDNMIQQCFTQIARLLQVDEDADSVKRKLANISQDWLLLFDNADDPRVGLARYFPAGTRGDIIITSRNPQCQRYNTVGSREVGQMSPSDSLCLLSQSIYGATTSSPQFMEEGKKIVEALGWLALAIVQAGSYICETACSLQDYLEIFDKRKGTVLQYLPEHLETDYQYSVYTTWQVSVDMIASRQDTVSKQTLRLLNLLGFYHHDQIPFQMFINAWYRSQQGHDIPHYTPWHEAVSEFFEYRQSVQASIALLASFSLITRNANTSLSLHPLVHEWYRDRIPEAEQQLNYQRALSLMTRSVEWNFKSEDYAFRRLLVPHVHKLLRLRVHHDKLSKEEQMEAWPVMTLILGENGWAEDALRLTEQGVELHKSKLGEDHPDTLESMHSLATRYSEAGRWGEALQLMEKVVELRKSKPGADHPDTLESMHSLATKYNEAGRWAEALQRMEQVVKLRKDKLVENHPDTLTSTHTLATWYSEAGRWGEALQLMEKVVETRKSKPGADHLDTLESMSILANWYREAGRNAEAVQLLNQGLELFRSKPGEDNSADLNSPIEIQSQMLQLAQQIVNLQKNLLGEDHPGTLLATHKLAVLYSEAGRWLEAVQHEEQVAEVQKSKLGEDYPDTLTSMHILATWYGEAGRWSEALQRMEQVVKLRTDKLGEDHPDTLTSIHTLAICYTKAGRHVEALQLTKEVVALRKSKLGEDHPHTLASMHSLAVLHSNAGRAADALELTEKMVELQKSKLGKDHPATLLSMHELALQYSEAGRGEEALQLTEKVLKLLKSKLGPDHPDTAASQNLLAYLSLSSSEDPSLSEASHRLKHSRVKLLQRLRLGRK